MSEVDFCYSIPPRPVKMDVQQALRAKSEGMPRALAQMGYNSLRDVQRVPVDNILAGRDIFAIAPTSAGKSAMFVVPTLAMNWRTLVYSPLVALMRDQVVELQRRGIRADFVNSQQSTEANSKALADWAHGKTQVLYVAPERNAREDFHASMTQMPPDMVVVDEAHCLSQWGDNFRPEYQRIGDFVARYNPKVVFACTATCTEEIEDDVCRVLGISKNCVLWQYYRRDNLKLSSRELVSDYDIVRDLQDHPGKTVIYFSTVKRLEAFAIWLQQQPQVNVDVHIYHGQMDKSMRVNLQDKFKEGTDCVMCATNAFGLGVNVTDIRLVIHRDPPGSPEALSQEVGRAGRDEKLSHCITYWHKEGWRTQQDFLESGYPDEKTIRAVYQVLQRLGTGGAVIKKTGEEIANLARVSRFGIGAVMFNLDAAGVIKTVPNDDKVAKVAFLGNSGDPRFQEYRSQILKGGMATNGSHLEVNMEWLRQQVGSSEETVRRWLRQWATDGLIEFQPPFRGKPRILAGDLSRVDFPRLAKKRKLAHLKLEMVKKYMDVPDHQKHDWFADYFTNWRLNLEAD